MGQEKGKVVFRRIRGRLVPIRVKKRTKENIKGSALVAGGLSLSAAFGAISGSLFKKATKTGSQAQNLTRTAQLAFDSDTILGRPKGSQLSLFDKVQSDQAKKVGSDITRQAGRKAKKMSFQFRGSKAALKFSRSILPGAIVGTGITTLLQANINRELTSAEEITSDLAGIGTVHASQVGFKKGLGLKVLRKFATKGKF